VDRDRLPALRTQFDGLLTLADELEARAQNARPVRSYDRMEAAVRARRRAVSRAALPPPPTSTEGFAAPSPAAEPHGQSLVVVVVAALVLLVVAAVLAVASDPIERFVRGGGDTDTSSQVDEPTIDEDLALVPDEQVDGSGVAESEAGSPSPCPAAVLLAGAQTVVGDVPVAIDNTACDLGFAVARVTTSPADPSAQGSGRAWLAYRLDDNGWQPLALGWITDDTGWIADCATVQTDVDADFPVSLCR
jgi:hypothetical protein